VLVTGGVVEETGGGVVCDGVGSCGFAVDEVVDVLDVLDGLLVVSGVLFGGGLSVAGNCVSDSSGAGVSVGVSVSETSNVSVGVICDVSPVAFSLGIEVMVFLFPQAVSKSSPQSKTIDNSLLSIIFTIL